jgi:Response regulator containing CheY-like receiver domain and AraC-type DNA-binding domain
LGLKLLIADDEDMIRNGLAKYIQLHTDRFDKIFLAENGQIAIDTIFRHKPELMLLDVQMPIKNGINVMQETQRAGIMPVTIILSGYDEFKYAQQAMHYGAKDYLLKPSRSSDILKKLNDTAAGLLGVKENKKPLEKLNKNGFVEIAQDYVNEHYYENLTLNEVSEKVGITAGYLSTLFSQQVNCNFIDYLNEIRIEHACTYLQQNYFKTYEIAYKVGFHDEKYFSKVFRKVTGMSPSEYKRK